MWTALEGREKAADRDSGLEVCMKLKRCWRKRREKEGEEVPGKENEDPKIGMLVIRIEDTREGGSG